MDLCAHTDPVFLKFFLPDTLKSDTRPRLHTSEHPHGKPPSPIAWVSKPHHSISKAMHNTRAELAVCLMGLP